MDRSTISRRIARLERQIVAPCFDRAGRRHRINESGTRLVTAAEATVSVLIRDVANLAGADPDGVGCVRIGTSEGFGASYLARRLATITDSQPALSIELVAMPPHLFAGRSGSRHRRDHGSAGTGNLRIGKLTSYVDFVSRPATRLAGGRP